MADHGPTPDGVGPSAERVEALAKKLLHDTERDLPDMEAARRAAQRMLEESEARTYDPAARDPEDDGVVRRTSGETAAVGDTGTIRRVDDGD